jgi:hypothetical protein
VDGLRRSGLVICVDSVGRFGEIGAFKSGGEPAYGGEVAIAWYFQKWCKAYRVSGVDVEVEVKIQKSYVTRRRHSAFVLMSSRIAMQDAQSINSITA